MLLKKVSELTEDDIVLFGPQSDTITPEGDGEDYVLIASEDREVRRLPA